MNIVFCKNRRKSNLYNDKRWLVLRGCDKRHIFRFILQNSEQQCHIIMLKPDRSISQSLFLPAPVSDLFAQSKARCQGTARCGYEKEAGVSQTALSQLHGQPLMAGRAVL